MEYSVNPNNIMNQRNHWNTTLYNLIQIFFEKWWYLLGYGSTCFPLKMVFCINCVRIHSVNLQYSVFQNIWIKSIHFLADMNCYRFSRRLIEIQPVIDRLWLMHRKSWGVSHLFPNVPLSQNWRNSKTGCNQDF